LDLTSTQYVLFDCLFRLSELVLKFFSPSNQWQDSVSSMLNRLLVTQKNEVSTTSELSRRSDIRGDSYRLKPKAGYSSDDNISLQGRRQRRRVGDNNYSLQQRSTSSTSGPGSAVPHKDSTRMFTSQEGYLSLSDIAGSPSPWRSVDGITSGSEDELTGAVGQLSLNEDEQVRYHGKASGLYLLGKKERVDRRNEGGIWLVFLPRVFPPISDFFKFRRFPKARVWPPLPSGSTSLRGEDEFVSQLPSAEVQSHLLELYFTHVHPSFPIIHKRAFFDSYTGYSSFFFFACYGTKSDTFLIELGPARLHLLILTPQITCPPSIVGLDLCQPSSSSLCMLLHRVMMTARLQLI
jgi:hypothetical protein